MRLIRQLWFQVLVAMLAGVLLGWIRPGLGAAMQPLGDLFINLIRMIVAPVIFCTVVHGIASMNDMRRTGRVALKALIWFEAITFAALVFALAAVNFVQPGAGMNIDAASLDAGEVRSYTAAAQNQSIADFLLHIVPNSFFSAFVQGDLLQVLFVSVLFAIALSHSGKAAQPLVDLIGQLSKLFFRIVGFIMWVAPLGAFGAMAFTVGRFGAGSLITLGRLLIEFYAVCLLFTFVVFGGIARFMGLSILRLLNYIREELLIVAATTSSETVLPRLMQKLQVLGCEEPVVGLVIPTGYSLNLVGTCLYLATVAVFLAQATNTPLSYGQEITLLLVALLTSKGAAGVAGAAFVVLAGTLASVGTLPVASVALVLGIHRLMSVALTSVNVVGNCMATIGIAKWERALDSSRLNEHIGLSPGLRVSVPRPAE
ncbi:MAG TPA: C4-dicarboxylate transporter DctA [Micropepsaceae bacterium]|nr:C4-dicarboxylate transporter DctA [Micropepsaceae bacterium]